MITLNDTPTTDNAVKWVVKILGDNNTYYMTDSDNGLTLTNTYIGDGLLKVSNDETISEITDAIDVADGGNIDQVSSFTFGIIRWSSNANLDGFMNEFYPATSGEYLVGREVNVGIVWAGANDSNITWFKKFYIEDYDYTPAYINIYCVEKSELDLFELPYYEIQKNTDNEVSYFTNAPEENFGLPIPIVYGNFFKSNANVASNVVEYYPSLSPGLIVDRNLSKAIFASHKCFDDSYDVWSSNEYHLYSFVSQAGQYILIYKTGTSAENNMRHTITMQNTLGTLFGKIVIPFSDISPQSDVPDVSSVLDKDISTYTVLDTNAFGDQELTVRIPDSLGDIGTYDVNLSTVQMYFYVASSDGTNRDFKVTFTNNSVDPPITAAGQSYSTSVDGFKPYVFSTVASTYGGWAYIVSSTTKAKWTVSNFSSFDYSLVNLETSVGKNINIYTGGIIIDGLVLSGFYKTIYHPIWNYPVKVLG